jgi:hypothetical protein
MAELRLNLPKTQDGIDVRVKQNRQLHFFMGLISLLVLLVWLPTDSNVREFVLIVFIFIFVMILLDFLNKEQGFRALHNYELKKYRSLCLKHDALAKYNASLDRLPVLNELRDFRRYDAEAASEALKKSVREMGSRCDR